MVKYPGELNNGNERVMKFMKFRERLEKYKYEVYKKFNYHNDSFYLFISSLGSPPFFYGQPLNDGYYIVNKLVAGAGSEKVYLVKKKRDNKKYVYKQVDSDALLENEINALKLGKDIKCIPSLVTYSKSKKYIIMEWCGSDLRNTESRLRKKLIPRINYIHKTIVDKIKVYHNDMRWKNITKV